MTVAEVVAANRTSAKQAVGTKSSPAAKVQSVPTSDAGLVLENRPLDANVNDQFSPERQKQHPSKVLSSDIGLYQDRTLPATLLMTPDSKRHLFGDQQPSSLKRCNSATLSKAFNGKSMRGDPQSFAGGLDQYNDFRDELVSHIASSDLTTQLRSKPSNTSDYVSDAEGVDGRKWRKRKNAPRLRTADRRKRISDCDSAFQDCSVIENEEIVEQYESELLETLQVGGDDLALQSLREKLKNSDVVAKRIWMPFDERTESQQNTLRSDAVETLLRGRSGGDSATENQQSSDTESMTESFAHPSGSCKSSLRKARQYDSDGGTRILVTSRPSKVRTRTRHRVKRTRSDGSRNARCRRGQSSSSRQRVSSSRRDSSVTCTRDEKQRKSAASSSEKLSLDNTTEKEAGNSKSRANQAQDLRLDSNEPKYQSTSLKTSMSRTVLEMPIYSQATWSGPGTTSKRKGRGVAGRKRAPKLRHYSEVSPTADHRRPHSARTRPRYKNTSRKLSIGGGGRYYCEYDTLPVDLSKLPADLVAKIGGQPDRLLEPLDKLNFDKLCRPLPALGEAESQLSARRLMSEKLRLPPDHRDREILSNTYELEDTGLVMTDL